MLSVKLIHSTPLWVASKAIRKCWESEDKSDTCNTNDIIGEKDRELIYRVGNKNKHASTLEHINYSFDIDGISRACLQELARHRHASLSVKSSRYTLNKLIKDDVELDDFFVHTGDSGIDDAIWNQMHKLQTHLKRHASNDIAKYMMPEAMNTSLVWTVNMRSLQNFLMLRTNRAALWEIQLLAHAIYKELPEEHKYMLEEFIYQNIKDK